MESTRFSHSPVMGSHFHRFAEAMNTAGTDRLDALAPARVAHQGAEEVAVDDLRTITRVRRKLVQRGCPADNSIQP